VAARVFRVTLDLVFDCAKDAEFVEGALTEFFEKHLDLFKLECDEGGNVVVWVEDVKPAKLTAA